MSVPNPSPRYWIKFVQGPGILSSNGAAVWKAPEAFPDSNSALDKLQSAITIEAIPGSMKLQIARLDLGLDHNGFR